MFWVKPHYHFHLSQLSSSQSTESAKTNPLNILQPVQNFFAMSASQVNLLDWFAPGNWSNTWDGGKGQRFAGAQSNGEPIGAVPVHIKAWQNKMDGLFNFLVRLDFTYSDGTTSYVGSPDTSGLTVAASCDLAIGETIETCQNWTSNWSGAYLNMGYAFSTSAGRNISLTPSQSDVLPGGKSQIKPSTKKLPGLGDHDWVNVGSGVLMGAVSSANDASYMSLLFLNKVESITLDITSYSTVPTNTNTGINMVLYETKDFKNYSSSPTNWNVSKTHTSTESYSWTIALATSLTVSATVSGKVYGLVDVSGTVSWTGGITTTSNSTSTEAKSISWQDSGVTPAQTETLVALSYGSGVFKTTYSGTLTVVMENNKTYTAPATGTFSQTAVGVDQISVSQNSLPSSESMMVAHI